MTAEKEDIYCAEQIKIPSSFPYILKQYAKAAIRTQPYDLLQWTCAYFRALANSEIPPVKERLEYPPFSHPTGITPGFLKTLLNVFNFAENVCLKAMLDKWRGLALPDKTLFQLMLVGKLLDKKECNFYKFLAIACGFLGKNLLETMIYVCELLTEEPEGGSAMIPLPMFIHLYQYLAELDCSGRYSYIEEKLEPFLPCVCSDFKTPELSLEPSVEDEMKEEIAYEYVPSETQSSDILRIWTECPPIDGEVHQVTPVPDGTEPKSTDRSENPKSEGNPMQYDGKFTIPEHIHPMDFPYEKEDEFYFGEEEIEEMEPYDEIYDYEPIGLEDILRGICECMEPVIERIPTPPPVDPFIEFLDKMKQEVKEGTVDTYFLVRGIGPPVTENRITAVGLWLADCARRQEGLVGPRNIRHFLCPDLDDRLYDNLPTCYNR